MSTSVQTTKPKFFKCLPIVRGDVQNPYDVQAIRMVVIHNVIIRSYNSVIYYAGQVEPDTKQFQSFLAYCELVNSMLHHHHTAEEVIWFPLIEEKIGAGAMESNIVGHQTFQSTHSAYEELLVSLKEKKQLFELETFRQAVYAFMEPLREHLREEIETIRADVLRKAGITAEDLIAWHGKMAKHVLASTVFSRDVPLLYINGDSVNGAWFPPMPTPIIFIAKYIAWYVHSDMWGFGSCDKHMVVKSQFKAYEPEMEPETAQ